jgi:hypothetical protein
MRVTQWPWLTALARDARDGRGVSDIAETASVPIVCPPWCTRDHTPPAPVIEENIHWAKGAGCDIKDENGKWLNLVDCELGAHSEADGTPGPPFVGFGPDWIPITEVSAVDSLIIEFTEVLARLREWRTVMANHG